MSDDGDFLFAQLALRGLQSRLQRGLFAQQSAFAPTQSVDPLVEVVERLFQLGDLVLSSENRGRGLAGTIPIQIAAGINAIAVQQFAAARDKIEFRLALAPDTRGG